MSLFGMKKRVFTCDEFFFNLFLIDFPKYLTGFKNPLKVNCFFESSRRS